MMKGRSGVFQGQLLAVLMVGALITAIVPGISPGVSAAGKPHLTVGGKNDTEAQLLTKLYVLLLRKAGFDVTEKAKLGTNDIVHNAIVSGQIDLYPEFTATGLARLKLKTAHNDQKDYEMVKAGYQKQFHITWLAMSPLNDTYGICTTQAQAGKFGTKISQLADAAPKLTVASPPDGTSDPNVLPGMKAAYGFTFGKTIVLDESLTFTAVQQRKADVNVCYTTIALIPKNNFVLLDDDKNLFPIYHPAPIVRDDTLGKAPEIATALNPLAPKLTTEVSQRLQLEVVNGSSVTNTATNWLKSIGML
ncbi:MAG TPA: glycine betaine ABC transporter substrate-binding protein [bacterium]|nr:glycine betaine ABC transporter substrate-binding protein [bacterium]